MSKPPKQILDMSAWDKHDADVAVRCLQIDAAIEAAKPALSEITLKGPGETGSVSV